MTRLFLGFILLLSACSSAERFDHPKSKTAPDCIIFSDWRIGHEITDESYQEPRRCACGLDLDWDGWVDLDKRDPQLQVTGWSR